MDPLDDPCEVFENTEEDIVSDCEFMPLADGLACVSEERWDLAVEACQAKEEDCKEESEKEERKKSQGFTVSPLSSRGLRWRLPSRSAPTWDGFFEKQIAARCGMHALNNLLGGTPYIEEEELSPACDTVLEESRYPDDQHGHYSIELRSNHEDASGWYSSEVLAKALARTFQYELVVHPLQDNPGELFAEQMIGALCHQDGPPKH